MIVVRDVFKQYRGAGHKPLQVLKGFSWEAPAGSITGLVGSNGCGKTTMLQIVMGILPPDSGDVLVDGAVQAPEKLRHLCSWVPELPLLHKPMSGKNILLEYALLCGMTPAQSTACLEDVAAQLPISDFWNRPSGGYSRGQSVLISLARFAVSNRPIWLLDEPTAGLDYEKVLLVQSWLRDRASNGTCIVLSTHLINDLKGMASQIVVLRDGRQAEPNDPFLTQWKNLTHQEYFGEL